MINRFLKRKRNFKIISKMIISSFLVVLLSSPTYAFSFWFNSKPKLKVAATPKTEAYKEWEKLSDVEKAARIRPLQYQTVETKEYNGKAYKDLKASFDTKFLLTDLYPDIDIKDQQETNDCWAFAIASALEISGKRNNIPGADKTLLSTRHIRYATTRRGFLNGQINDYGWDVRLSDGGNFERALEYLSDLRGPVSEKDFPFENNVDLIEYASLNKPKTVYDLMDTRWLNMDKEKDPNNDNLKVQMKDYLKNHGTLFAVIAATNNKANIMYSNVQYEPNPKAPLDHAVLIIGWDDEFSKDNFTENKPQHNGAWIALNSWGSAVDIGTIEVARQSTFEDMSAEQKKREGISEPRDLTADRIKQYLLEKYKLPDNKITYKNGNFFFIKDKKELLHISYDDATIYSDVVGIGKVRQHEERNVYSYDELGVTKTLGLQKSSDDQACYIANVFDRQDKEKEILNEIGVTVVQEGEYSFYVNPVNKIAQTNATEKDKQSSTYNPIAPSLFKPVRLKDGQYSIKLKPGFYRLEIEPVELSSSGFGIMQKQVVKGDSFVVPIEAKDADRPEWNYIKTNPNESFISISTFGVPDKPSSKDDTAYFHDMSDGKYLKGDQITGNVSLKAYTVSTGKKEKKVSSVSIVKKPDAAIDRFSVKKPNTKGAVIEINYTDNTSKRYNVEDLPELNILESTLADETRNYQIEAKDPATSTKIQFILPFNILEEAKFYNMDYITAEYSNLGGQNYIKVDNILKEGKNLTGIQYKVAIATNKNETDKSLKKILTVRPEDIIKGVDKLGMKLNMDNYIFDQDLVHEDLTYKDYYLYIIQTKVAANGKVENYVGRTRLSPSIDYVNPNKPNKPTHGGVVIPIEKPDEPIKIPTFGRQDGVTIPVPGNSSNNSFVGSTSSDIQIPTSTITERHSYVNPPEEKEIPVEERTSTTSDKKLPKTGTKEQIIIASVSTLGLLGAFMFVMYRRENGNINGTL